MKYIVEPQREERQHGHNCSKAITECALCSEDTRFCGDWE